ncbi:phage tail sheath subtilisin-like domain-containing protein [Pseudoxanthomonas daejeonensis]|uniref:phage tail sheath family protein n=1 Tax=Pseudoxanthomonas daejeonensis TaxID=266062 RepID=UPI001F547DBC|nr:phage tail sheath subtilisin-like domain-containing protein [Pseudoxanthomonas daejeonensis]UNK56302.1 phage tail sheath subtilisin-like domain-containing protein [Pseudoxanthomonas daejeonensis]
MPEYLAPGVYVEETAYRSRAIQAVSTTTCAFVGPTRSGPVAGNEAPELLTSVAEFERIYGSAADLRFGDRVVPNYLAHAVRAYFEEGGVRLYVARVAAGRAQGDGLSGGGDGPAPQAADYVDALAAIDALEDVSTFAAPGATALGDAGNAARVLQLQIDHASHARAWRMAVLETPPGLDVASVRALRRTLDSKHAALYYPWVVVANPAASPRRADIPAELALPPAGFICGIFARNDVQRGVHKAPANEVVRSALRFDAPVTAAQQDLLNPEGVNCLRTFPGRGNRVWGARTLSSDPEWKYVPMRRYFNYLEASLDRGTRWAALEPNGEPLWAELRTTIDAFLHNEWRNGALLGTRSEQAYFVRCDRSTMTQDDLDHGRVVCLVGVAAIQPAEFMIFRITPQTAMG